MERSLGNYHPIVSFTYFFIIIGMSMLYMHPVFVGISFISAISYSYILNKKRTNQMLKFTMIMALSITIVNGLFVNRGLTVLFYFRNNPITLESISYGLTSGIMMASVVIWFSCYNEIITSDKFLYIFSKILPSISLMINMTIRLMPRLIEQTKIIANTQKTVGLDYSEGTIKMKIKSSMRIISILVTWALEDAVQTADSMKARGYGIKGRSNFSIYRFIKRDIIMISIISTIGVFLFMGYIYGYGKLLFYPNIESISLDGLSIVLYLSFFIITILPTLMEIVEAYKWKYSEWTD